LTLVGQCEHFELADEESVAGSVGISLYSFDSKPHPQGQKMVVPVDITHLLVVADAGPNLEVRRNSRQFSPPGVEPRQLADLLVGLPGQQFLEPDLPARFLHDLDRGTTTTDVVAPDHLADEALGKPYYIREGTLSEAVKFAVTSDRMVLVVRHTVWSFHDSWETVKQRQPRRAALDASFCTDSRNRY
jgi:hypothetical protein